MERRILLTILIMMTICHSYAYDNTVSNNGEILNYNYSEAITIMVITENNDKETCFMLSDQPIITHYGNVVKIATSNTTVEFNMANVKNFTFRDTPSSVETITRNEKNIGVVEVFTPNGHKVMSIQDGIISLKALPKGIYIIKTSSNTYKVSNK